MIKSKRLFSKFIQPEFEKSKIPINNSLEPSYSIKKSLSFEEKKEKCLQKNALKNNFQLVEVQHFYMKYINDLLTKNEIKTPVYNSIKNIKFMTVNSDFLINLEFTSNVSLSNFQEIKHNFLEKLRFVIQNYDIEFNCIVTVNDKLSFIDIRKEIFREMVKKNPLVLKLKNELGLII